MTALTDEKLRMIVGGADITDEADDLPMWWRKFKVCVIIICDRYDGMTNQQILDDIIKIFGCNSWEVEYAKKKLHLG